VCACVPSNSKNLNCKADYGDETEIGTVINVLGGGKRHLSSKLWLAQIENTFGFKIQCALDSVSGK